MNKVNSLYCLLLVAFSLSFISCSDGKKDSGVGNAVGNRVMRESVELPHGKERSIAQPMARITINKNLEYYVQCSNEEARRIEEPEVPSFLAECCAKDSEMYVALYVDEVVPYSEVVKVLNIANENKFKIVLATRRSDTAND